MPDLIRHRQCDCFIYLPAREGAFFTVEPVLLRDVVARRDFGFAPLCANSFSRSLTFCVNSDTCCCRAMQSVHCWDWLLFATGFGWDFGFGFLMMTDLMDVPTARIDCSAPLGRPSIAASRIEVTDLGAR